MSQISAKIIAHSKAPSSKEIVTFELEYPRFIHSELMTHRMFSRNAASSRAIPVAKMIEQVRTDYASPVHWGKNQPGMQAKEELQAPSLNAVQGMWEDAAKEAAYIAEKMGKSQAHKQVVNRILEPFQWMKTVVTATEFENFFWLRNHEDAQPEIKKLAEKMLEALKNSRPVILKVGEWHVPYYGEGYWKIGDTNLLNDVLAISSSCCAQVSYRLLDQTLEKALMIYDRLVESEPVHASPFEHQATPMKTTKYVWTEDGKPNIYEWEEGITHVARNGKLWSGNFCGWIQHRQLIPNNVKK